MKTSLILGSVLVGTATAVALLAQLATNISVSIVGVFAFVGSVSAGAVILMAVSDYGRKPRFRVHKDIAESTARADVEPATMWAYTTQSA